MLLGQPGQGCGASQPIRAECPHCPGAVDVAHPAGRSPAEEVCASEASDNLCAVVSSPLPLVSAGKRFFFYYFF